MKPQLLIPSYEPSEFDPSKVEFDYAPNWSKKKPKKAFWTSTYIPELPGSDWTRYVNSEYRYKIFEGAYDGIILTPKKTVTLCVIDSLDALKWLWPLDFAQLSKAFDGIHLTEKGQWETRLSYPENLYGWDCESTCWLNMNWVERWEVVQLHHQHAFNIPRFCGGYRCACGYSMD